MLTLGLQTFIKWCHLDQVELTREISRKLNGEGGHNFYWSLKEAIHAYIDGSDPLKIESILDRPSKDAERKYNRAAFNQFVDRFAKVKQIEVIDDTRFLPVAEHGITIKADPWFTTFEKGHAHLHLVWATQRPLLAQRHANIGSFVLREMYKDTALGNSRFCIMDLVKPKRYSDATVGDQTALHFELVCRNIDVCAKSV